MKRIQFRESWNLTTGLWNPVYYTPNTAYCFSWNLEFQDAESRIHPTETEIQNEEPN